MDHIRIDEGIKRGPRKKPGPKPSSPRRKNGQILETLSNDPEAIKNTLEAYRSGAKLQDIADKYNVTIQAVYSWLLGNLGGEQHANLVTQALTSRIASADERLETADNPLELARAREQCRWARMDLERRRPNLYGPKQEVTHVGNPTLNIHVAPQLVQGNVEPALLEHEIVNHDTDDESAG